LNAGRSGPLDSSFSNEIASKVVNHLLRHRDDLSFRESFWKKCEPSTYEFNRYRQYADAVRRRAKGESVKNISRGLQVNPASVDAWVRFRKRPKLVHYLCAYLELGKPKKGWTWFSVNNSSGHAVPYGPFVEVPSRISSWADVEATLNQIRPLGIPKNSLSMEFKFGFVLGVMVGDASKKCQRSWHRHLELTMSMKYETNLSIGNFFVDCLLDLGLRAKRMRDLPPGNKPRGFFAWESQSSALIDWLFNVCLGLGDRELTTYNQVRMDWALEGPPDFRRGLLQGMNESDGSVNISGQEVDLWVGPSLRFAKNLLGTFGVRSFENRGALSISKGQVRNAFEVPIFSPILKTFRYVKLAKLAGASHISHGRRIPKNIRRRISALSAEGHSVHHIAEEVIDEFGVSLSFEAVQRWASRRIV
jgi:hypothetical protein